jgi:hypothetical protein
MLHQNRGPIGKTPHSGRHTCIKHGIALASAPKPGRSNARGLEQKSFARGPHPLLLNAERLTILFNHAPITALADAVLSSVSAGETAVRCILTGFIG